MAVKTFTKTGNKATTTAKLDKKIFGVAPENHELLKQAYVSYLANGRESSATTKTRGLVRGGGRKPWRQKGTGRARFGSSRNPIWRGGGIVFGPSGTENYTKKLNTTAKRLAIRQALSLAADSKVVVIEEFAVKDNKTSEAAKLLSKIGATKKTLVVVDNKSDEVARSVSNLKDVKLVQATYLNVFDILNADSIVITNKALASLSEWLNSTKGGEK